MAITEDIKLPKALHMIYPVLDMSGNVWVNENQQNTTSGQGVTLSSRAKYANDGVLPLDYQLLLGQCLFRKGGDPTLTFYFTIIADIDLLQYFPQTFI